MNDLSTDINDVKYYVRQILRTDQDIAELSSSGLSQAQQDEQRQRLQKALLEDESALQRKILQIVRFPPHHVRHKDLLQEFWKDGPFDDSVFVMTKYPDPQNIRPEDTQLSTVIEAVRSGITKAGFKPRLASDRWYHAGLWDNVELYLLGSSAGVAIVEDRYLEELNPNVVMEWGWLRGMGQGKDVLYLVEEEFAHDRADLSGLMKKRFFWNKPGSIVETVETWLRDRR